MPSTLYLWRCSSSERSPKTRYRCRGPAGGWLQQLLHRQNVDGGPVSVAAGHGVRRDPSLSEPDGVLLRRNREAEAGWARTEGSTSLWAGRPISPPPRLLLPSPATTAISSSRWRRFQRPGWREQDKSGIDARAGGRVGPRPLPVRGSQSRSGCTSLEYQRSYRSIASTEPSRTQGWSASCTDLHATFIQQINLTRSPCIAPQQHS